MTLLAWIAALGVTAFAAAVQGSIGFGFAVISVPILLLVHPSLAPVPQLLMSFALTVPMAWRERHELDLGGVGWILLGRLPGAMLGLALLVLVAGEVVDLVVAALVLAAVGILGSGFRLRRTRATECAAGVFSGASAIVSSIGGPPLALLFTDEERTGTVRATLAVVFTVGIAITTATRALGGFITAGDVRTALVLLPGLVAGYLASGLLRRHVNPRRLRRAILVLSTVAALALVGRVLLSR